MKRLAHTTIPAVVALLLLGATVALAQADPKHSQKPMQHGMSKMDMSAMMKEPHAVLAMAYGQNITTFAHTLNHQAKGPGPLDVGLARAAVAEIRRSLDQMDAHHGEHMKTVTDTMRSRMADMIKDMETHHAMLKDAVVALERDVQAAQLDAKQVAVDSGNVLKHLDEMSKMHDAKKGKMMK